MTRSSHSQTIYGETSALPHFFCFCDLPQGTYGCNARKSWIQYEDKNGSSTLISGINKNCAVAHVNIRLNGETHRMRLNHPNVIPIRCTTSKCTIQVLVHQPETLRTLYEARISIFLCLHIQKQQINKQTNEHKHTHTNKHTRTHT